MSNFPTLLPQFKNFSHTITMFKNNTSLTWLILQLHFSFRNLFQCWHTCHYSPINTVQAFKISHSEDEILKLDSDAAREIIYTELTMSEFAEALSMPAESEFVRKVNCQYKSMQVKLWIMNFVHNQRHIQNSVRSNNVFTAILYQVFSISNFEDRMVH
jgi:hypothetical protein